VRHRIPSSAFPWILAVFIVMFPLSTNLAFYSSYWASLTWWLLAMAFLSTPGRGRAT
jgi:hypothetical protein